LVAELNQNQLEKEIQILRLTDHPNIIKLLGVYEDESHIYIVTELVEDGTLEA
jgi:doublecortin-like kinase 3